MEIEKDSWDDKFQIKYMKDAITMMESQKPLRSEWCRQHQVIADKIGTLQCTVKQLNEMVELKDVVAGEDLQEALVALAEQVSLQDNTLPPLAQVTWLT